MEGRDVSVLEQGASDDFTGLDALIEQMRADGRDWAQAKADYYAAKAQKTLELRASGMAVGTIQDVVKGDAAVNLAMLKMDCAEVNYKTAQEAVMARKMQVKTINEQRRQEWYS